MLDETDKGLKCTAFYAFARLQNATALETADEIFSNMCLFFNSRYMDKSVSADRNKIDEIITKGPEVAVLPSEEELISEDKLEDSNYKKNQRKKFPFPNIYRSFMSPAFLQNQVDSSRMSTFFQTSSLTSGNDEGITRDTNNCAANWFAILKRDKLQRQK